MTDDVSLEDFLAEREDVDLDMQANMFADPDAYKDGRIWVNYVDGERIEADQPALWHATDERRAEWCMNRARQAQAAIQARQAEASEWWTRLDEWLEHSTRKDRRRLNWLTSELERYALDHRTETGEKTTRLPSGEVSTRESHPQPVVEDPATFTSWAYDELHSSVYDRLFEAQLPKVRAVELRKVFRVVPHEDGTFSVLTDDGQVVPGLAVRLGEITATVIPGKS